MTTLEKLQNQLISLQQRAILLQQNISYTSNDTRLVADKERNLRKLNSIFRQIDLIEDRMNSKFNEDYMYNKWRRE